MSEHAACRCGAKGDDVREGEDRIYSSRFVWVSCRVCGRRSEWHSHEIGTDSVKATSLAWASWDTEMGAVEKARESLALIDRLSAYSKRNVGQLTHLLAEADRIAAPGGER